MGIKGSFTVNRGGKGNNKPEGPTNEERYAEFAKKMAAMIVENLEKHNCIYKQDWEGGGDGLPFSLVRGSTYAGTNMWMLMLTGAALGYSSNAWLTFKDASALGGNIKKGEHGTQIMRVIWDETIEVKKDKDGNAILDESGKPCRHKVSKFKGVRFFTVFNYDQCEHLPPLNTFPSYLSRQVNHHLPDDNYMKVAEEMCENAFVRVSWGGSVACYVPELDYIRMPDKDRFYTGSGCLGTAAHELGHATGHKNRLNRDLQAVKRWGDDKYAFEELVAEMTAYIVCAMAGVSKHIEGSDNRYSESSAAYISHWIRRIKEDPEVLLKAVIPAATAASAYVIEHTGLEKILENNGFHVGTGVDNQDVSDSHSL